MDKIKMKCTCCGKFEEVEGYIWDKIKHNTIYLCDECYIHVKLDISQWEEKRRAVKYEQN